MNTYLDPYHQFVQFYVNDYCGSKKRYSKNEIEVFKAIHDTTKIGNQIVNNWASGAAAAVGYPIFGNESSFNEMQLFFIKHTSMMNCLKGHFTRNGLDFFKGRPHIYKLLSDRSFININLFNAYLNSFESKLYHDSSFKSDLGLNYQINPFSILLPSTLDSKDIKMEMNALPINQEMMDQAIVVLKNRTKEREVNEDKNRTILTNLKMNGSQYSSAKKIVLNNRSNIFNFYFPLSYASLKSLKSLCVEGFLPINTWKLTNLTSLSCEFYCEESHPLYGRKKEEKKIQKLNKDYLGNVCSQLTNLSSLTIQSKYYTNYPIEGLKNCSSLTILSISSSDNVSAATIAEIATHKKIKEIKLVDCNIGNKAQELCSVNNLKKLSLCDNGIEAVPSQIKNLTSLLHLDLSKNLISTIPAEISKLTRLKSLLLNENKISLLPQEISSIKNLNKIEIGKNLLTSIPDSIYSLKNLVSLAIKKNQIREISSSISSLAKLKVLDASFNCISEISSSLLPLTDLTSINFSHNNISEFHRDISGMTALKSINLQNNKIRSIPPALTAMSSLTKLNVISNPILNLPKLEVKHYLCSTEQRCKEIAKKLKLPPTPIGRVANSNSSTAHSELSSQGQISTPLPGLSAYNLPMPGISSLSQSFLISTPNFQHHYMGDPATPQQTQNNTLPVTEEQMRNDLHLLPTSFQSPPLSISPFIEQQAVHFSTTAHPFQQSERRGSGDDFSAFTSADARQLPSNSHGTNSAITSLSESNSGELKRKERNEDQNCVDERETKRPRRQ